MVSKKGSHVFNTNTSAQPRPWSQTFDGHDAKDLTKKFFEIMAREALVSWRHQRGVHGGFMEVSWDLSGV